MILSPCFLKAYSEFNFPFKQTQFLLYKEHSIYYKPQIQLHHLHPILLQLNSNFDELKWSFERLMPKFNRLMCDDAQLKSNFTRLKHSFARLKSNFNQLKCVEVHLMYNPTRMNLIFEHLHSNIGELKWVFAKFISIFGQLKSSFTRFSNINGQYAKKTKILFPFQIILTNKSNHHFKKEAVMNKREESKLKSYSDIIDVVEKPPARVGTLPAGLTDSINNLKQICSNIKLKESMLKNSTLGKTEAKDNVMHDLIDETLVIAGAVYAYAASQKNIELENFADISEADLNNLRVTELPIKVKAILDQANILGGALVDFGVSPAEVDKVRTLLDDYNQKSNVQSSGFTSKSVARESLTELFNSADKMVIIIEKLMKKYEKSFPDYYNSFEVAKNIKNKAVRHKTNGEETPADTQTENVQQPNQP